MKVGYPGFTCHEIILPLLVSFARGSGRLEPLGNSERNLQRKGPRGRVNGRERVNVAAGRMRVVRGKSFLNEERVGVRSRKATEN